MNASEMEYLEARLQAGLRTLPSPEHLERLVARAHTERNRHLGAAFASLVGRAGEFVTTVRAIAKACTAARLYSRNI